MGERSLRVDNKMPSQLWGLNTTNKRSSGTSTTTTHTTTTTRSRSEEDNNNDDDDRYYMARMREILSGFPNTGPPSYPVQILDHVYMGNQRNADNIELLRRYGITHVLNCAGQRRYDSARNPYSKDSGIKEFLLISAEDTEDFNIAVHFDEAIAFLDRVRKVKGKALVHCNLGVNRSGAVVAAYLLAEQKRTLLEVINYLKVKRFIVLSNKGFRRQLVRFARTRGRLDPILRIQSGTGERSRSAEEGRRRPVEMAVKEGGGSGDVVDRQRNGKDKLDDFKVVKNKETGRETSQGSRLRGTPDYSKAGTRTPSPVAAEAKPSDPGGNPRVLSSEDPGQLRQRVWTLPRYNGRGERDRPDPTSPSVEVIVSDHGVPPGEVPMSSSSSIQAEDTRPASVADGAEPRAGSKPGPRQLEPVYETKSCDTSEASTGTGNTTTGSSSGGRMSAAAESVSAKLSGFFSLLGPKRQPLRSTSYSNVSTSKSPSPAPPPLGAASLPPPLSGEERMASTSSGSLQTTSLSTTRPLRIYTRSSTDTEIYRTRQDNTRSQTAGQSGLPRFTPRPSKS